MKLLALAFAIPALLLCSTHAGAQATIVADCSTLSLAPVPSGANLFLGTDGKLCGVGGAPSGTADVNLKQVNGTTVTVGAGTGAAGTQRVTTSTDSTIGTVTAVTAITNALPAGTNVIGHVITDSGSTMVVTGTVAATQSGTWTVQPGNTANTTAWKVDGSAVTQPVSGTVSITANSAINVAQVNGVTTLAGAGATGTGSQRTTVAQDTTTIAGSAPGTAGTPSANFLSVQGGAANNATASGNPVQQSCVAISAEATAATAAQNASCVADLAHKQIVLPYANPENFVSGTTSAMTGTTSTSLIASPGGSLRNYITNLTCVNSHATVGTFVTVQDGSGGTALYTLAAASVFGGSTVTFPTPLRQPTTATALFVANVTTGANVICSATGYKGL